MITRQRDRNKKLEVERSEVRKNAERRTPNTQHAITRSEETSDERKPLLCLFSCRPGSSANSPLLDAVDDFEVKGVAILRNRRMKLLDLFRVLRRLVRARGMVIGEFVVEDDQFRGEGSLRPFSRGVALVVVKTLLQLRSELL